MFKILRDPVWPPALDLSTVRETIAYMEGDLKRVPGLEAVAKALKTAIAEIDAAERAQRPKPFTVLSSKFLPRR